MRRRNKGSAASAPSARVDRSPPGWPTSDALLGGEFELDPADFGGNHFTPETLATTLTAALASAEAYVFLWNDTVDWLGASSQPGPPQAYVDAVTRARADSR